MHQPPPDIIAAAQAADRRYGVPASITLAQWALESGWGAHMPPGSNNPFGIKARPGEPAVHATTREVYGSTSVHITQPFRAFASLDEAFDAHARLLAIGGPYAKARVFEGHTAANDDAFGHALTGVYATDPQYGTLLHALMAGSNLYQYDIRRAA